VQTQAVACVFCWVKQEGRYKNHEHSAAIKTAGRAQAKQALDLFGVAVWVANKDRGAC